MRSVPVVHMQPGGKLLAAFVGVLINAGVSPFAQGGLDKAFGFAIGAGCVRPGKAMLQSELAADSGKVVGAVGGAIVGEQGFKVNAEAGVILQRLEQEGFDRFFGLVRVEGGEGDAGMVVDGDMMLA